MNRKDFIKRSSGLLTLSAISIKSKSENLFISVPTLAEQLICVTCGTQFPKGITPELCTTCLNDRQYIPVTGQKWTTHEKLQENHSVKIQVLREDVYELEITPRFAIGQRAFLILSKNGNILWDCFPLLDDKTIEFINSKGGLKAIAFSHPHYFSNMNFWAMTFDCQIYIHHLDAEHIVDRTRHIILWEGNEKLLWDDIKLINIGGHFPGSSILLTPSLSEEGTVFCGDTLYLSQSLKHFAVMYSYANLIPLPLKEVQRIRKRFEQIKFDAIYGFLSYQNMTREVKKTISESLGLYNF